MMQPRDPSGKFAAGPGRSLIARFLSKVDGPRLGDGTLDPSACWAWTGAMKRRRSGRVGKFFYDGRTIAAARIALAIKTGELKGSEIQACHTRSCPTGTECVNWDHLYWGDEDQNKADHVAEFGVWGMNRKYGRISDADGCTGETAAADDGRTDEARGTASGADTTADPYAGVADDDPVPF